VKQLKIFFQAVISRVYIIIVLAGWLIGQTVPSIHQTQLEYYNQNYILPELDNIDPIRPKVVRDRIPSREVFGYHPYWMGTSWQNYNFDLISTLAYFSAEANTNGSLGNLHGWPITGLINEAHDHGTNVVLCVTLFSSSGIETLLSNTTYRQNLIDNLLAQVQAGNADGVNVDFESFPASQKENMVTFITDLTETFHSEIPGSQVTLAMPAVDWNDAWDYNALATISDGLFIMGYAYHWSGSSTSGPVSPLTGPGYTLTWTVLDYLEKTNFQADKLILGIPYYGYEWPTTSSAPGAATTGTGVSKTYSEMEPLALSFGKQWHESSQTPWYYYQDSNWNQGWYDDSLSLSLKYDFALYHDLKGIGMWALGYDGTNPELWELLYAKFSGGLPPTSPTDLSIKNIGGGEIQINFNGANGAEEYIVIRDYLEIENDSDTLGIFSESPIIMSGLIESETYFFIIVAKNIFGNSDPTEMLGVVPTDEPISCLIVNGFDRMAGTNNTFDFIRQHGSALHIAGYSFDSASNEAVINGNISLTDYDYVDWILGEEGTSTSAFAGTEQTLVKSFLESGRFLFVSGSEIGYDLSGQGSTSDHQFYTNYLKADYISDAAGSNVYSGYGVNNSILDGITGVTFDDGSQGTYDVDWPDGIFPVGDASICAKYDGVNYSTQGGMGVEYVGTFGSGNMDGGLVYLAVGFETIYPESKRNELMMQIMNLYQSQLAIGDNLPTLMPSSLVINKLYPNPTNTSFTLKFSSILNETITITITDILGRVVNQSTLTSIQNKSSFTWDGLDQKGQPSPTGLYLVSISNGKTVQSRKVTLLK
jgi:spore germination protein YaaH